ncbi:putative elicitor peptide [Dioscorea sansibarensis]
MEEQNGKKEVEDGSSVTGGSGFCHPCSWMPIFITSFVSCFGLLDHDNDSKDPQIGTRNIDAKMVTRKKATKKPTKPPPSPGHGGQINKVL